MSSTNPEDPIFYTYILLDPRKSGTFIYDDGNLVLEYLPIYAGKGHDDRCDVHLKDATNTDEETDKLNLLREIVEDGYVPKIIKVLENVTEKEAFDKERYVIRVIGRADLGLGPLLNRTNGGDGFCGFIRTEEHQNKIAEANRGQTRTDEQKQRMSEARIGTVPWNKGIPMDEQTLQEMTDRVIAFYETEEGRKFKEYLSAINSGENHPQYGTKQSEEEIEKRLTTRKKNGYWQKDMEEISEAFSNGAKKRFSDPEERQKASERVKGKRWYNNGKQHGQYWTDKQPEGWILGMLLEGKKWYNNGIKQSQFHPDKRPEGWELGRLKFKTK